MSSRRNSQRTVVKVVAQVAVVLLLAAGTGWLITRGTDRSRDAEAGGTGAAASTQVADEQPIFDPHPILMVVSDSIGNGIGDVDMRNYPQILGDKLGFQVIVDAVGARGFLPTDLSPIGVNEVVPPFAASLKRMSDTYRADYIIVDGGRNDLGKNPEEVAPAIDDYLVQLRKAYPKAKIAVLVPSYITTQNADNEQLLAASLRTSAEKVDAYVFDPVAEGWYRDVDLDSIRWTDGIHLNQNGAEYYATRIYDDMIAQGMAKAGAAPAQGAS